MKFFRRKQQTMPFGGGVAGRMGLQVRAEDVFLVSYPKSGNTWARFLVANLVWGSHHKIDFTNIESRIPSIYDQNDEYFAAMPSPRIIKSHEPYHPKYKKVVYFVRDPRSVLISYLRYLQRECLRPVDESPDEFAMEFLEGDFSAFGNWYGHVASWTRVRRDSDFLGVKYEAIQEDPVRELEKIAIFLELPTATGDIKRAVEASSFGNMRRLEEQAGEQWLDNQRARLPVSRFVREGRTDEWRETLSNSVQDRIWARWEDLMLEWGYEYEVEGDGCTRQS